MAKPIPRHEFIYVNTNAMYYHRRYRITQGQARTYIQDALEALYRTLNHRRRKSDHENEWNLDNDILEEVVNVAPYIFKRLAKSNGDIL